MNKKFTNREDFEEFINSMPVGTQDNCEGTYNESMFAGYCNAYDIEYENGKRMNDSEFLDIAQSHAWNLGHI